MRNRPGFTKLFLTDMLVNAGGIATGQMLLLLATPVLARVYTPADFGIYASLVAICGIIANTSALRFDMALPSTKDNETGSMYRLGLLACGGTLTIGILGVSLGLQRRIVWPQSLMPPMLAMLSVVSGMLQALVVLSSAMLVRHGKFFQIALLRIVSPACFIAAALLAAPGGLPAAFTFGLGVAAIFGLVSSWERVSQSARVPIRKVAYKYWEYPLINMPMSLLDAIALSMPLLFIVQYYGDAAGGNFSQVQRLGAAPLILCASAVTQVFYKHAGDVTRTGESARPLMWKTVLSLGMIGVILIVLIALVGEPVLSLLLGKGWRADSSYLLLVLLPAIVRVCVSPITSIFFLTNQIKLGGLWQVMYAIATWSTLSYASSRFPLDDFLLVVVLNDLALYSLYLWMADVAARKLAKESTQCAA